MTEQTASESCPCGATFETSSDLRSTIAERLEVFRREHRHDVGISLECVDELADRLADALLKELDARFPGVEPPKVDRRTLSPFWDEEGGEA